MIIVQVPVEQKPAQQGYEAPVEQKQEQRGYQAPVEEKKEERGERSAFGDHIGTCSEHLVHNILNESHLKKQFLLFLLPKT